jgi:rare lipoprotein A
MIYGKNFIYLMGAVMLSAIVSAHPTMGRASWYGGVHQNHKMANGQRFDKNKMTAASFDLPLGSMIRVLNLENGLSVVVEVTDRGPAKRLNRILDLSEAAAIQLDYRDKGLTKVLYTRAIFDFESSTISSNLEEDGVNESKRKEVEADVQSDYRGMGKDQ